LFKKIKKRLNKILIVGIVAFIDTEKRLIV
jgi:hypothetical protein